jgi:hypothetical protein
MASPSTCAAEPDELNEQGLREARYTKYGQPPVSVAHRCPASSPSLAHPLSLCSPQQLLEAVAGQATIGVLSKGLVLECMTSIAALSCGEKSYAERAADLAELLKAGWSHEGTWGGQSLPQLLQTAAVQG